MGMYCQLSAVSPEQASHLQDEPESIDELRETVSLEKSWHGLHYLLTGSATDGEGPLGFLLHGGEAIGDGDPEEEGASRLLSPAEVEQIHSALGTVSDDQLWSRFDPRAMESQQIYPSIWDEPEQDLRDEYLTYFQTMKDFFAKASQEHRAVIVDLG